MGRPIPADNSRNNGQFAFVPHAYATFDLSERLKGGFAITVPFGNTIDYSEDWAGRYVNIKTAALSIDINPNVSFKITDRLAIAGGVSLQYLEARPLEQDSAIPDLSGSRRPRWRLPAQGQQLGLGLQPWPSR